MPPGPYRAFVVATRTKVPHVISSRLKKITVKETRRLWAAQLLRGAVLKSASPPHASAGSAGDLLAFLNPWCVVSCIDHPVCGSVERCRYLRSPQHIITPRIIAPSARTNLSSPTHLYLPIQPPHHGAVVSLLRLAIQKTGRLTESSRALVSECEIELEQAGAKLRAQAFFPWRCQGRVLFTRWL